MKARKIILIGSLAATLGLGIAFGITGGGQKSVESLFLSSNKQKVARIDKAITIAQDVSKPGNAVYLALPNNANWYQDSAKFAIRFHDSIKDKTGWTSFIMANAPIGTDGVGNAIYQAIVPEYVDGATSWTHYQAFRFHPDQAAPETSNNWGSATYQSIVSSKNQIKITGWDSAEFYTTSASERIGYWANADDQWTKDLCDEDGNTDTGNLVLSWLATSSSYSTLPADVKDYFRCTDGGTMARYDYIYEKYGEDYSLADFALRYTED